MTEVHSAHGSQAPVSRQIRYEGRGMFHGAQTVERPWVGIVENGYIVKSSSVYLCDLTNYYVHRIKTARRS